jgi:hypothetical protein
MPARLIVAYVLIAVIVAAIAAGIARARYMSRDNVIRRARKRDGS